LANVSAQYVRKYLILLTANLGTVTALSLGTEGHQVRGLNRQERTGAMTHGAVPTSRTERIGTVSGSKATAIAE
jgi:hypothetical protein